MNDIAILIEEYDDTVQGMERESDIDVMKALERQRMILHEQIIDEVKRMGIQPHTREEAVWIARCHA